MVDEDSVGIAEHDGAVAPQHRGWFLDPALDEILQARVLGFDVVDARAGSEQSDHL